MAKVLVTESYLSAIGNAIREKNFSSVPYTPGEMAQAILDIPTGGVNYGNEDKFIDGTYVGAYINDRVTRIDNKIFRDNPNITSVSFENVESITDETFYESGVQSITFPSLKSIGNSTFENCDSLDYIDMPNLESIGTKCFYDCDSLINISFPSLKSIGNQGFSACDNLLTAEMPNLSTIGEYGFAECPNLINAVMPNITEIGAYAFQNCSSLNNIETSNVTSIGEYAFDACSALPQANYPKLTSLGSHAFLNSGITSVSMPKLTNSENTATNAFYVCKSLKSIDIPNLTNISYRMFCGCSVLENVSFPLATGMMGVEAFASDKKLKTVSLPNIDTLGNRSFSNCNMLESVYLPKITIIPERAFEKAFAGGYSKNYTLNLTEMMPGVETIETYAFEYAYINSFISKNTALTMVKTRAFEECEYLKYVDFYQIVHIEDYAFNNAMVQAAVFRNGFVGDLYGVDGKGIQFDGFRWKNGVSPMHGDPRYPAYIYVPRSSLDANGRYKDITNVNFRAIEDYTVDGTLLGDMDLVKMGLEAN